MFIALTRIYRNHRLAFRGAGLCAVIGACAGPVGATMSSQANVTEGADCPSNLPPEGAAAADAKDLQVMLSEVKPENIKQSVDALVGFGTRNTYSDTTSTTRGIGAARTWIKSQFDAIAAGSGRTGADAMQVSLESFTVGGPNGATTPAIVADNVPVPHPVDIVNVLAVLPGSTEGAASRRYYLVAHYDSRASGLNDATTDAPGANDNAAAIGVMLELARVMSKRHFGASIAFLAVAGEEQDLYGSRLHAQAAKQAGIDVRAAINNDIIGDPSSPDGASIDKQVRVFSEGIPLSASTAADLALLRKQSLENDSDSRNLARYSSEVARWQGTELSPLLEYRSDRVHRSSDHFGFNEMGVPAIRITTVDETLERQHQDVRVQDDVHFGDVPDFVDPNYAAKVARLDASMLQYLANAPEPPKSPIALAELTRNIRFKWTASSDADLVSYEILWRNTADSSWEFVKDVGNVTEFTFPITTMNKDNLFFGIRAVDRDGYRSPVVTLRRQDCTLVSPDDAGPASVCP